MMTGHSPKKHEVNNTTLVKLGKMIGLFEKKENLDSMLQGLPSSTENQVKETFSLYLR